MDTINTLMTLTMIFLNIIKTVGDCPRSCECKWKSGKESVFCVDANMTEIPKQLDSGTQVLVLTGNRLQKIGADEFLNASLLNLQKIFLSRCRLEFIHRFSFRKIINLVELDLSYNDLSSVPSHTFEFIKELRELRLNGNPIVRLLNNAFKMVPRLTKLDLSECRIGYVELKAFEGLENSLEWLKLDKNKITNIKSQALVSLRNLHGLELAGNPWNCSCGLKILREWMLKQNVPHSVSPLCKNPPRLSGKGWDKLGLEEFACPPRIEAAAVYQSGEEGDNVTMSCSIGGVPDPSIRWLKKNHMIANSSGGTPGAQKKFYVVRTSKEFSNLTIVAADAQDNGAYVCRAENKAGRSEANITLTIVRKPALKLWSSRMMIAFGVVSLLFASAVGLLTYCAWTLRKRKSYVQHPETGRDLIDGYEMNHKNLVGYNKIREYGNNCSSGATEYEREVSVSEEKNSDSDAFRNCSMDTSERTEADQLSSEKSRKPEKTSWKFSRMSETEDGLHCRSPSYLHIFEPKRRDSIPGDGSYSEDFSVAVSSSLLALESLYPRAEVARGASIYFSGVSEIQKKFPDLLELSQNEENVINNNFFSTTAGRRNFRSKRTRRGSFSSESQSPLLPASSGESCDSNCSFGGKNFYDRYTSLPTSPNDISQTPILQILDGSQRNCARSAANLKFRSWELEKFLTEYRNLQHQLFKMKESCENLKEENLRFRERENVFKFVESATISKMIPSVYLQDPLGLPDFNNFGALYNRSGFLKEHNNNPETIVKDPSNPGKNDAFWPSGEQLFNNMANFDSRSSSYKS